MAKIGILVHPLNEALPELKQFRNIFARTIRSMAQPAPGMGIVISANPEDVVRTFDTSIKTQVFKESNVYMNKTVKFIASLIVIQMKDKLQDAAFKVAPLSSTTIALKGHSVPFKDHGDYIANIKLHQEGNSWLAGVPDGTIVTNTSSLGIPHTVEIGEYARTLEYGNPNNRMPGSDEPHPIPPRPHWGPFFAELPNLIGKRYVLNEITRIWKGMNNLSST